MEKKPVHMKGDGELCNAEHIAFLVTGYIRQILNDEEHDELDTWVETKEGNMILFEEITDEDKLRKDIKIIEEADLAGALKKCKKRLSFSC